MSSMWQPDVGPGDLVIHLVNPYKCGDCGAEFCLRFPFLEHLSEHISSLKTASPYHQMVCVLSLVEHQPNGITVTRDILQINDKQMFELQEVSLDHSQLTPLKTLEAAGVLSLPQTLQVTDPGAQKLLVKRDFKRLGNDKLDASGKGDLSLLSKQPEEKTFCSGSQVLRPTVASNKDQLEMLEQTDEHLVDMEAAVREERAGEVGVVTCKVAPYIAPTLIQMLSQGRVTRQVTGGSTLGRTGASDTGLVCPICYHKFADESSLQRHRLVHTGVKPYSCNICFREFRDVSAHQKHALIHRRQHRCPVCHRKYLRKMQLHLHMKQHGRKRFVQFGQVLYEMHIKARRTEDGQVVHEYTLPIVSNLEKAEINSNNTEKISKVAEVSSKGLVSEGTVCPKQDGLDAFKSQETQTHGDEKKKVVYQCGHCQAVMTTRSTLSRHLIKHTKSRPFQCETCWKTFGDRADLLHHRNTHRKPVHCQGCGSAFSKTAYLQNHLQKGCPATDSDGRFTLLPDLKCRCHVCQRILKNKANMVRHLRVHAFQDRVKSFNNSLPSSTNLYTNDESQLVEVLSQNVEDHYTALPESVGYHCLICGQDFRFRSFIVTHVRIHLNQRPFKCRECPKSFYTRNTLKKHEQNHTRPYKCPACNRSFIRRYLMKEHFKKRHELEEDPLKDITELWDQKLIQCDICGKTMKSFQKSIMLSHIRLHRDVRPFKCKVCHKSFISDIALKKHALNHTKPYQCHVCQRSFSRRYLMMDHFNKSCAQKAAKDSGHDLTPVERPKEKQTCETDNMATSGGSRVIIPQSYESKIIVEKDAVSGNTIYTCEPCDKSFTFYDAILRHVNTFAKPTPCKHCRQIFDDKHLTIAHQRSCLGVALPVTHQLSHKVIIVGDKQEKVREIMKKICTKIETLTSESFKADNSEKIQIERSINNTCDPTKENSPLEILINSQLTRTISSLKKSKETFSCPECDKSFNTSRGLKIHASSHVRLFQCEVCLDHFTHLGDLRKHIRTKHPGQSVQGTQILGQEQEQAQPCDQKLDIGSETTSSLGSDIASPAPSSLSGPSSVPRKAHLREAPSNIDNSSNKAAGARSGQDTKESSPRLLLSGTRGRPFSCQLCRRRFTEVDGLNAHMFQNHGVRS